MWRGTTLPVMPAKPSCSASFKVFRSIAWLAARRTRRSCQGDFASHCSVKSRKITALVRTAVSFSPGVRRTSSATGPPRKLHHVGVSALERGGARGLVRDALEDEPLHARDFSPVAFEGLHDDLDTRRRADELVRPGADRRLLEALVADLFDIFLRHDPAGAGGRGP